MALGAWRRGKRSRVRIDPARPSSAEYASDTINLFSQSGNRNASILPDQLDSIELDDALFSVYGEEVEESSESTEQEDEFFEEDA